MSITQEAAFEANIESDLLGGGWSKVEPTGHDRKAGIFPAEVIAFVQATLRTHLVAVPARISTSARRMVLHLPTRWPYRDAWYNLWAVATAPT